MVIGFSRIFSVVAFLVVIYAAWTRNTEMMNFYLMLAVISAGMAELADILVGIVYDGVEVIEIGTDENGE